MTDPLDPTTAAIEAQNKERDQRRSACTDVEVMNVLFVQGYDQAVREIRDHFAKMGNGYVVAVIEEIWLKKEPS